MPPHAKFIDILECTNKNFSHCIETLQVTYYPDYMNLFYKNYIKPLLKHQRATFLFSQLISYTHTDLE